MAGTIIITFLSLLRKVFFLDEHHVAWRNCKKAPIQPIWHANPGHPCKKVTGKTHSDQTGVTLSHHQRQCIEIS